jgi:protein-S-isoprenylcysteine O-methyltransferase Ste14
MVEIWVTMCMRGLHSFPIATPFTLGSLWALIAAFIGISGIVLRFRDEEKFFTK